MYKDELNNKLNELTKIITWLERENSKKNKIDGHLRIAMDRNKVKYFHITQSGDTKGKYIKKSDAALAQKLAESDYHERILKEAKKEKSVLEKFLQEYTPDNLKDIYESMHKERQKLIKPLVISDDEYARQWENEIYDGNPYKQEELIYDTAKGEKVRTKSEGYIANMYYNLGIPYKYEHPVKLKSGAVKYPDFILLRVADRKVIYHEHMGLLDDDDYRINNLKKLREYEKSGIRMGDNLIITFETSYCPLDITQMKESVKSIMNI